MGIVNDRILRRVLTSPDASENLQKYLKRGFRLTDDVITSQLRDTTPPSTLRLLQTHVPPDRLKHLTTRVLQKMFGPDDTPFHTAIITTIVQTYTIPDSTISSMLLTTRHGTPYRTRCYERTNPTPIWKWVLAHYGPRHKFTKATFWDVVSWTSELSSRGKAVERTVGEDPYTLIPYFLEKGCSLAPGHIPLVAKLTLSPAEKGVECAFRCLHHIKRSVILQKSDLVASDDVMQKWIVDVTRQFLTKEFRKRVKALERNNKSSDTTIRPGRVVEVAGEVVGLLEDKLGSVGSAGKGGGVLLVGKVGGGRRKSLGALGSGLGVRGVLAGVVGS
ncbi:hypothetical protein HDV00_007596 [Rhizophlyctis rosea]|nr:hypothetical protein HDV00_007596 [Rhizophlyctis rosea]